MGTYLKIDNIRLWARVGVLKNERKLGQLFTLDIFLWANFEKCEDQDDINSTIDYSKLIEVIKYELMSFSCFTIERFSDEILKIINKNFEPNRVKIILTKCNPPITGFEGKISIVRSYEKK